MQAIDGVGRKRDGRIEAEAVRRADDVVVDRFRHADDRNAALAKLFRDRECSVAADHDERVESHLVEHLDHAIRVEARTLRGRNRNLERIPGVNGAENRAAEAEDAGNIARRQDARSVGLDEAVEAVLEAHALDPAVGARLDDGADDGVQARGIATAREDTETFDERHVSNIAKRNGRAVVPLRATKLACYTERSRAGRAA